MTREVAPWKMTVAACTGQRGWKRGCDRCPDSARERHCEVDGGQADSETTVAVRATVEELSGKSSHTLGIVGNSLGSVFPLLTLHRSVPFPLAPC